jgi:Zn-dependent peptidase ImmA (M78 family)
VSTQRARSLAEDLAQRFTEDAPPVAVEHIARALDLELVHVDLATDTSGVLVTVGDKTKICVQEKDHRNRRRFTIAHEIGHFVLKHNFGGEHVHVDKGSLVFTSFRNPRSSKGIDPKEIEANQFASCLLMPAKLVRRAVEDLPPWPLDDPQINTLAKKFQVSVQAMTIRLTSLNLI